MRPRLPHLPFCGGWWPLQCVCVFLELPMPPALMLSIRSGETVRRASCAVVVRAGVRGKEGPECRLLRGEAHQNGTGETQGRRTAARQNEVPRLVLNISFFWLFVMKQSQQVTVMLPLSHQLTNVYPFGSFLMDQFPHFSHYLVLFF